MPSVLRSLSISFVFLHLLAGDACERWIWRNPLPQGNAIQEIIHDGSDFWAVGNRGLIMHSPNGWNWTVVMSGLDQDFRDIVDTSSSYGYAVVGSNGVFVNSRDGENWTEPGLLNDDLESITYWGGQFVAVGSAGRVFRRIGDFNPWEAYDTTVHKYLWDIMYDDVSPVPQYLAVGQDCTLATSVNGITWTGTQIIPGSTTPLYDIEYTGSLFIVSGWGGLVLTSPDLVTWTDVSVGTSTFHDAFHWQDEYFVMGRRIYSSPTATNFEERFNFLGYMREAACSADFLVAVGDGGRIFSSVDGMSWNEESMGSHRPLEGVAHLDGQFVAVSSYGQIFSSGDGVQWDEVVSSGSWYAVTTFAGQFVAVGSLGRVTTSIDGVIWNSGTTGIGGDFLDLSCSASRCVAVGGDGFIAYSDDLETWQAASVPPIDADLNAVDYSQITLSTGQFVAVGNDGEILSSADGATWSRSPDAGVVTTQDLNGVCLNGLTSVAVGTSGTVIRRDFGPWTLQDPGTGSSLAYVWYRDDQFEAFGSGKRLRSPDGVSWSTEAIDALQTVRAGLKTQDRLFYVGTEGMLVEVVTVTMQAANWPETNVLELVDAVNSMCH